MCCAVCYAGYAAGHYLLRASVEVSLAAAARDRAAAADAFEGAEHVVQFETWTAWVTGVPMEPRAAVGLFDEDTWRYTFYAGRCAVVRLKNELAGLLAIHPPRGPG